MTAPTVPRRASRPPSRPEVAPGAASAASVAEASLTGLPAGYDELPDGVLVAGPDLRVTGVNASGRRMLHLQGRDVAGRPLAEVLPLLDEQGNEWWECSRRVLALPGVTRQPERRLTLALPVPAQGAVLGERDLLVTSRIVREDGRLVRLVVAFRDTTARERHERSSADLVSTVAHELRSPLTSVKGFTATLLARWERFTDEQKKHMLTVVNHDADRVTRLLAELLDVSRIEAKRLELHRQVVDVPAAVRRAVESLVAAGEPADRFVVQVGDGLPETWLDPDKLDQVLGNLLENALRHGAGTVTVELMPAHAAAADGTPTPGVAVTVEDEGQGIPDAAAGRVFTKFWRGQPRSGGTGLGLFITRGLVEAHGGTITAGRASSGGARLRFTLPAGTPAFAR